MSAAIDAVNATHQLVEQVLAAPPRVQRAVSAKVARQMLYLLGDNEYWAERPSTDDMLVWTALRHENEFVRSEVAVLFPQQAEALRAGYKSWGFDWLRSIVSSEREDALAVVAAMRAEVAAEFPAPKAARS